MVDAPQPRRPAGEKGYLREGGIHAGKMPALRNSPFEGGSRGMSTSIVQLGHLHPPALTGLPPSKGEVFRVITVSGSHGSQPGPFRGNWRSFAVPTNGDVEAASPPLHTAGTPLPTNRCARWGLLDAQHHVDHRLNVSGVYLSRVRDIGIVAGIDGNAQHVVDHSLDIRGVHRTAARDIAVDFDFALK